MQLFWTRDAGNEKEKPEGRKVKKWGRSLAAVLSVLTLLSGCGADHDAETGAELQIQAEAEGRSLAADEIVSDGDETFPEHYLIEEFPIIYQMPELPTGCEITALTMVLHYYGFSVDKTEMAARYLPTLPSEGTYYGADGLLYGNDLNQYFLGDPATEYGITCGTGAIITAADSYLADCGSLMTAEDGTGSSPEELYELVSEDIPVVVWCTIDMHDRVVEGGWYTESGTYVDWGMYDHGAVLIGYDSETVTIADPLAGEAEYDREQFEKVYEERGSQCVVLVGMS